MQPSEAGAGSVLEVSHLSKSFAGLKALDDVSFTVRTGEILGLIGPNGSGKTTLINVVTGLLPATSGAVTIDGVEITKMKAHRRGTRWYRAHVPDGAAVLGAHGA